MSNLEAVLSPARFSSSISISITTKPTADIRVPSHRGDIRGGSVFDFRAISHIVKLLV